MGRLVARWLVAFVAVSLTLARAQTFQNPLLITTALDPATMVAGDFNADGKLDLAYLDGGINLTGANLHVLLGKGNGSFSHGQDVLLPAGVCACSLTVSDVNHDGIADLILEALVSTNYSESESLQIAVLPGNGDGTFGTPILSPLNPNASAYPTPERHVAVGDVNGDGNADLVISDAANSQIYVATGDGAGHFQLAATLRNSGYPSETFLADLNGDGHQDIVALGPTGGLVAVYLGNGNGTFGNEVDYRPGIGPNNVILTDINGDGRLDVVTSAYQSQGSNNQPTYEIVGMMGNGDGTFSAPTTLFSQIQGTLIDVRDYNGDGTLDLAILNNVGVGVLLGQGSLTYKSPISTLSGASTTMGNFVSGDFNGDGHPDMAMGVEGGIVVLLGKGDGTFPGVGFYDLGQPVGGTAIADFNSDGNPDIAMNLPGTYPRLLLGNGDGTFQLAADQNNGYGSPPAGTQAVAADFNGDGKVDLVANSYAGLFGFGTPAVYFGNGQGDFAAPAEETGGSIAVADFNGDHRADMISVGGESITVLLGQASGSFQQVTTTLRNPTFAKLSAIGDINHDGKPDLAIVDQAGLEIWFGNGDGTFTFNNLMSTSPLGGITIGGFGSTAIIDLDGDGNADLIFGPTSNSGSSVFIVLYGNGDGTFQAPVSYPLSHSYTSITVADVNGDKKPDLIFNDTGSIAIIDNLGSRSFGPEARFVAGTQILSLSIGDVNHDGYPDIVVSNGTSGTTTAILLNEPTQTPPSGLTTSGVLTVSPEPSNANQPFTATLAVSAPAATDPAPAGTVTFIVDSKLVGEANLNGGSASISDADSLATGTHTVAATFNGDANYASTTYMALHTVSPPVYATSTALAVAPTSILASQTVRMQATVTNHGNGPTPTGYVTFMDGTQSLGGVLLNSSGIAYFDTSILTPGLHSIVANYEGIVTGAFAPEIFLSSASSLVSVTVNTYATTTTVSSSSATPTSGTVVTLAAAVTSANGAPFGSVTFHDGNFQLGTSALDGGQATFSTASLSSGAHSISAAFNANGVYGGSVSQSQPVTVQAVSASLIPTLTAVTQTQNAQGGMTLTAQTAADRGQPSGQITFLMDGVVLGSATTGPTGEANLVTSLNPASGPHRFYASFAGSAPYAPSASPTLVQTWQGPSGGFSLGVDTHMAVVHSDIPALVQIAVAAPSGDTRLINLACQAGLPAGYSCMFSHPVLMGPGSSTLTIGATQSAQVGLRSNRLWKSAVAVSFCLLLCVPCTRRRGTRWALVVLLSLPLVMGLGCDAPLSSVNGNATVLVVQASSGSGPSTSVQSTEIVVRVLP